MGGPHEKPCYFSRLYDFFERAAAFHGSNQRRRRQSAAGLAVGGRTPHTGGAWTRRHQGQQARRRRRDPERHLPATAIVVAWRSASATAYLSAGAPDRA